MDVINEDGTITYNKGEQNEVTKKQGLTVKLGIDPQYVEDKETEINNLRTENEELKEDLNIIATKELKSQINAYGLPENATVEDVKNYKQTHSPIGGASIFSQYQNQNEEGFDSIEDLILFYDKQSKEGDKEATKILNQLANKVVRSKPLNVELESPMRTIARKPQRLATEPIEVYQKRLNEAKKSAKWRDINEQ